MDALGGSGCKLLRFGRVRFPFTFMGVMALAIGLWVVVYLAGHRSLDPVLDDVVERGEKILDEVEKLASASQLPVETELVQARDTGPALVDEAVEWGADLIVMGLPYKRRFGEFNLGKTVPYVLKNANCRVMLFREHREHREASA